MKIANILLLVGIIIFVIALISLTSKILGTFGLPWEIQALIIGFLLILTASWIIKLNR
jgi:hypothetical protein